MSPEEWDHYAARAEAAEAANAQRLENLLREAQARGTTLRQEIKRQSMSDEYGAVGDPLPTPVSQHEDPQVTAGGFQRHWFDLNLDLLDAGVLQWALFMNGATQAPAVWVLWKARDGRFYLAGTLTQWLARSPDACFLSPEEQAIVATLILAWGALDSPERDPAAERDPEYCPYCQRSSFP